MSKVQLLRSADRVKMPWKNGGGVTHEIAVFPEGAGMDDFHWRLSMAEVSEPGPFSTFAGIDRVLALLDGRLRLSGPSIGTMEMNAQSTPSAFSGDTAIYGEPLDGPVLDLNAMARRGSRRVEMLVLAGGRHAVGASSAILVALGPIHYEAGGDAGMLDRLDCVRLEGVDVAFEGEAGAILVYFLPV